MSGQKIQAEAEHIHPFLCHPARRGEEGSDFATSRIYACGSGQKIKQKKKKIPTKLNRILLKRRENSLGF